MPPSNHKQSLLPCFLRYTTLRKRSVIHPQIIEPVQNEMKDYISVSFIPNEGGNISLERDVAKFNRISITLSSERKNIFMDGRLTWGDWDRNPGLGTMNSSHSTATVKEIELREMTSRATSFTIWPRLVAKMVETEGDVVVPDGRNTSEIPKGTTAEVSG